MADIIEKNEYPGNIPLIEKGEKVEGGETGVDNRAPTLLTHRTNWLKNKVEEVEGQIVAGAVFITDIKPQSANDNVGGKVRSADGFSLLSCNTTTSQVTVAVTALTGHSSYRPTVTVEGKPVTLTAKPDSSIWTGEVAITLGAVGNDGLIKINVKHDDGATASATTTFDTAPIISRAVFTGTYPAGQTELKAGDVYNVEFTANEDVVAYEIENSGAFVAKAGTFTTPGKIQTLTGLVIADRGNTTVNQGFRVRAQKASGAWSNWYDSKVVGTVDGVNVVKLNNIKPVIKFGNVGYPPNQTAIKSGEQAAFNHTIENFDTVAYTSTELTITLPTVYEAAKVVAYKVGTYNVSSNNITVKAKRSANGAEVTANSIVNVANAVPVVTMTLPATRLRSGGANGTAVQRHTITLTSDQSLSAPPSMNAPEGTWDAAAWVSDTERKVWTRALLVADTNAKGNFSFNTLKAIGLAGVSQTAFNGSANYVLGGFVFRKLAVAAWPNREAAIGTQVSDTTKLRCSNLGKGQSGSLNSTFQANLTNTVDKFTITGPTGVLNSTGNLWYNLDAANASSNTGGILTVELEEAI